MKKLFVLSLILALAITSVAFGQVSKTKTYTKVTTIRVQNEKPAAARSSFTVSPKVGLMGGITSSFGLGCEFAMPITESIDGMAEVWFVPGNGWSMIGFAGNGVYKLPAMAGTPVNFYVGGGLLYDMISASGWTSNGSFSAIGFQGFGGADYPIPGAGTVFGQMKYALASFNYTVGGGTIGGFPIPSQSYSQTAGGFGLEGGYRISF